MLATYDTLGVTRVSDALICQRIVRDHARTFALASRLLPAHKRRGANALYAFCRVADDIVDVANPGDPAAARHALAAFDAQLADAIAGRPDGPLFRELRWAVQEFGVPAVLLHELVAAVGHDLGPVEYGSWAELSSYCEGVASTVGVMCAHVFGVHGGVHVRPRALRYARTLGIAMQLTNILRDVGEDARRGRCYLPEDDLAMFGLARDEVLHDVGLARDERWAPFMAFEVGRARALYEAAGPGIDLLEPDAQPCARACSRGYAAILGAIEQNGYDSISSRARIGFRARAAVLLSAWRGDSARRPSVGDGPRIAWDRPPQERPSWT
jgi:phytoene synthase